MIDIGSRRECFFDDFLINTRLTTAEFRIHEPIRRETLITFDRPWEGDGSTSQCLVKAKDHYRLYYIGRNMIHESDGHSAYCHCVAFSKDGLHWERPNLGLIEYDGSTDNNILCTRESAYGGPMGAMFVFYDENPACPETERWKMVSNKYGPEELFWVTSPDGIHFDFANRTTIDIGGYYDSLNTCFWDKEAGKYRCYYRGYHLPDGYDGECTNAHQRSSYSIRIRDIMVSESADGKNWTALGRIDMGEAEDIELYENVITPYYRAPHMLIGFPTRYMGRRSWTANYDELCGREKRTERYGREPRFGLAVTDCTFMCSRDGLHFERRDEAFIRPGPENGRNWLYGDGYPSYSMLETPSAVRGAESEISLLVPSNQWIEPIDLDRYTIRKDGFVSLHAGGTKEETVVTKPFTFEGENLYANIATSARGHLYFTLSPWDDRQGMLPVWENPRAVTSCEIFGDCTDRRIPFEAGALEALAGKRVVMTVRMRDADLYAIRFGKERKEENQ